MCAAFELNSRVIRPGKRVRVWRGEGVREVAVWAGFAKSEIITWWKTKGWVPIDVPAERYAERSDRTRQLIWDHIPSGLILRGLLELDAAKPIMKIVTRASTPDELIRFEHPRMPLLERPLFSAEPLGWEDDGDGAQLELF